MAEECNGCETKIKLLKGDRGPKGERGERGERGPTGATGATGDTGPQGNQGVQGATGNTGAAGIQGNQGEQGEVGPQGIQGIQGIQGEPGNDGEQGIQGEPGTPAIQPVIAVQDTNTIDLTLTGGPSYTLQADVVDTGWVDLLGFDFYDVNPVTLSVKPQCRRIGNVVHFRGRVTVPLPELGTIPLEIKTLTLDSSPTSANSYIDVLTASPFTGVGGVTTDAGGSITFNNSSNVIPSSVVGLGQVLDGNYSKKYTIGTRLIPVAPTKSSILTTVCTLMITSAKKLVLVMAKDEEDTQVSPWNSGLGRSNSPLNYIISHVVVNDYVPNFAANSKVQSNAASGVQNVTLNYFPDQQYPFTCNANEEGNLGGFTFNLDGLIAYLEPCNNDLKGKFPCV